MIFWQENLIKITILEYLEEFMGNPCVRSKHIKELLIQIKDDVNLHDIKLTDKTRSSRNR